MLPSHTSCIMFLDREGSTVTTILKAVLEGVELARPHLDPTYERCHLYWGNPGKGAMALKHSIDNSELHVLHHLDYLPISVVPSVH